MQNNLCFNAKCLLYRTICTYIVVSQDSMLCCCCLCNCFLFHLLQLFYSIHQIIRSLCEKYLRKDSVWPYTRWIEKLFIVVSINYILASCTYRIDSKHQFNNSFRTSYILFMFTVQCFDFYALFANYCGGLYEFVDNLF